MIARRYQPPDGCITGPGFPLSPSLPVFTDVTSLDGRESSSMRVHAVSLGVLGAPQPWAWSWPSTHRCRSRLRLRHAGATPNNSPRRMSVLAAFGSARTNGLPLELCGPASHLSFLLRLRSDDTDAQDGRSALWSITPKCRKATLRRFGRSDRSAQQPESSTKEPAPCLLADGCAIGRPSKPDRSILIDHPNG